MVAAGAAILVVTAVAAALWIQSMSAGNSEPSSTGQGNSRDQGKVSKGKVRKAKEDNQSTSDNSGVSAQTAEGSSVSSGVGSLQSIGGASSPVGKASLEGYVAQLGSFRNRKLADERRSDVGSRGSDAFVVRSSEYEGLTPGYWVVLSGPFDSEAEAGEAAAASGVPDAFVRWISG